jgi:hypothetical protein
VSINGCEDGVGVDVAVNRGWVWRTLGDLGALDCIGSRAQASMGGKDVHKLDPFQLS